MSRNKSVNAPANTILPNNFIDDVYDEVRIEVGSRSARNFCSQSDDFK